MTPYRDAPNGELYFTFGKENVIELDDMHNHNPRPQGMCFVDFVVERSDGLTRLIEVKDPSHTNANRERRDAFVRSLRNLSLITSSLVPKARDSYCYMHLMKRDDCVFDYVFVIGSDKLSLDGALLSSFHTRLVAALKNEGLMPWTRFYLRFVEVVPSKGFETHFRKDGYKVVRTPGATP